MVSGAGAAGLCAARHLSAHQLRLRVFEQTAGVGGTWVYSEEVGSDSRGLPVHSSMYTNLRTNLPKEVMAFPDFPFRDREDSESFLHHSDVLEYLQQYCDHFNLRQYIQFNTLVAKVHPSSDESSSKWTVTSKCLRTSEETVEQFDSVLVCNGHYSVPVVPSIPGLELFRGRVLHSHNYRRPEDFSGERVVVLGGGASGTDICMELSSHARSVHLAHNNPALPTLLPANVRQVAGVRECVAADTFVLGDGSRLTASVVLLATGYSYSFPFLSPECGVEVTSRRVTPLFKHLVNINQPSMCFVGIPIQICPFPQFDLQIRYFVKTLTGEVALPSKQDMMTDLRQDEEWRRTELKLPEKHFHKMGTLQWRYNKEIAALGKLEPICNGVENLYNAVHERRRYCLPFYKNDKYSLVGSDDYKGSIYNHETGQFTPFEKNDKNSKLPPFIC